MVLSKLLTAIHNHFKGSFILDIAWQRVY